MLGRCIHRGLAVNRCWISQSVRLFSNQTYYDILGVPRNATSKQIQDAFLDKSKQMHPDKKLHDTEQHAKFVQLNEAYTCLNRLNTRVEYDATLPQENVQRVHVSGEMDDGNLKRVKRGLFRVPKERWYQFAFTSLVVGVLAGMFYLVTLDLYQGREQELFLLFKSPEALDPGEEEEVE